MRVLIYSYLCLFIGLVTYYETGTLLALIVSCGPGIVVALYYYLHVVKDQYELLTALLEHALSTNEKRS